MKYILFFLLLLSGLSLYSMEPYPTISHKLNILCESPDTNLRVLEEYIADLGETERMALTNETFFDGQPVMQAALKICIDNSRWELLDYLFSIFNNWEQLNLDLLFDDNLSDDQCETAIDIFCKYKYYQPSICILF